MPTKAQLDAHLVKDKASGVYQAKFKDATGATRSRSTKSKNIEEARAVLDKSRILDLEIQAKAGTLTAEALTAIMAGRKVTCASALAEWAAWRKMSAAPNTVRTQQIILQQFFALIGADKWAVNRLTFEHLDGFVNSKEDETGRSNRDLRLASVRSFFQFLTAKAYYVGNPSHLVRVRVRDLSHEQKERTPRVPFTEREFKHIISHTEGQWRWWTMLSYWAGLRISDCACLEWGSLLPDEIVVWTRKGESRVALPIDDPLIGGGALRSVFFELMEHNRHGQYVFPGERDVALNPEKRARHSVYYTRILAGLGIEGKSFHCLRHSFATRLSKAGKSVEDVGRLLGHAKGSTKVTEGYVHK
jgi:integrase